MATPHDASLESQLAFETLITDVSSKLVAASDEALASTVDTALEQAARFCGADRGLLLSVRLPGGEVRVLHCWCADTSDSPERRGRVWSFAECLPWTANLTLTLRQPLVMSETAELPPEAQWDSEWFTTRGVRSAVWVPIAIGSEVRFVLSFESSHTNVAWPHWLVQRLPRLGEILAHLVERKRTADILRETEARITLATLVADVGVWDWDLATGRIWATPAARALYGFALDAEVTHETFLAVVHPEDVEYVRARLPEVAAGAEFDGEYRVVLPGGAARWLAVRGRARTPVEGASPHILGISVDVSARKRAEAEERANIGRLQAAVDAAGLGFYLTTDRGETAVLDQTARDLIGAPPEMEPHFRGFWLEHVHPDDRGQLIQASREIFEGGAASLSRTYRYRHPTRGLVWIHHTLRAFERDAGGKPTRAAGVLQDITDQKRAEEEMRTLSRHLIKAQEAERTILARDLHDDVTQRMAVLAIELGRADPAAPAAIREPLQRVREGLVRLSEDVHSLAYRLHPAVLEELGLVEALRTECERRGRQGGVEISLQLDPAPAGVAKDAALCLYRVAQEALTNAYRHAHASEVNVVLRQVDGGTMLAIRDDGVGFEPQEPRMRGSLGLVSMRERLRLVGGTLDIDTAPGHGTVVIAWVPGSEVVQASPPAK